MSEPQQEDVWVSRDEMLEVMRFVAYKDVVERLPELKEKIDMLDTAMDVLDPVEVIEEQTLTHGLSEYQYDVLGRYIARVSLINAFEDYEG